MQPSKSLQNDSNLQFKQLDSTATLPSKGSPQACGLDLYSLHSYVLSPGQRVSVRTGIAVQIPLGHYGRVAPRSGLATKHGIDVLAGVIDPDYRGEIQCILINLGSDSFQVSPGDRIAQLIIEKIVNLEPVWVDQLDQTERNKGGFGSTGT